MSVNVSVYGAECESDEYQAALKLKETIQKSVPDSSKGEIVLFASATLFGQDVKDIDLMMIGTLQNYKVNLTFNVPEKENGMVIGAKTKKEDVEILSFCTTIEIKRHDITGIYVNGTDFYVQYNAGTHCVTAQSNKQKIAAMNFFKQTISFSPFITNIIWFTQVTRNDINGLLINNGRKMPSNVIGGHFDFKDMMQLLVLQKCPKKIKSGYIFDSEYNDCSVDKINDALSLFSKRKEQMGELTRKRIEMLTNKAFINNALVDTKGKVSIYRGRAGTGKTVGLIQMAIPLVDEQQERVLILTYNKALVSDIRRLFALAELPDMFEESCVYVNTMHSYFYRLSNSVMYNGKMSGKKFLDNYNSVLNELNEFMLDDDSTELVKEIARTNSLLYWDYVLIDEAQDWCNAERDIILKIFDKGKIIVADGGHQFVRNLDVCDWSVIRERNNIKLKYCLRQKENIVHFLNLYSQKLDMVGAKIISNNNMPGGKVVITTDDKLLEIHSMEMERLVNAGNIAYDMLYLVPYVLVSKKYGKSEFVRKKEFEQNGIFFWDGTSSSNREGYTIEADEVRVLQYNSARGLEGWTVVCMDFDVFLEEKAKEYVDGEANVLLLESPVERKKRYLFNWAMIPLTRAIDTLIISLKNPASATGIILKELSEECKDFVMWM